MVVRICSEEDVHLALVGLDESPAIIQARRWPGPLVGLDSAGLYSWWVDETGAKDLGLGLEQDVLPGRIYAGQAGATKWPSGSPSGATLRTRITTQHLGGNIYGSTFRLTIAAALATALQLVPLDRKRLAPGGESVLSEWIRDHLSVAVHPYHSSDALEDLELRVLARLDPPLNLRGMPPSSVRTRLVERRKALLAPPVSSQAAAVHLETAPVRNPSPPGRVTLHSEIAEILRENGNLWMSTQEIADLVNARGRYLKRDGSPVTAFQVHGRTRNYAQFLRQGSQVRLVGG